MTLKIGSWIIGVGCFLAFIGLCFLPAAFGAQRDATELAAGAMVFSTGMVLAAAGFYMKARYWGKSRDQGPSLAEKAGEKFAIFAALRSRPSSAASTT